MPKRSRNTNGRTVIWNDGGRTDVCNDGVFSPLVGVYPRCARPW